MNNNKILIVDDEQGTRESLKRILDEKHDLILTESYEQCMDCLKNDASIGLAFLDIKILRVNGIETLKKIRDAYPDLKIVITTGYKNVETAAEAINLDADRHITKPFRSEEILEVAKILFPNSTQR